MLTKMTIAHGRFASYDGILNRFNDVPYIIIADVWAGWETHTYLEQCF